MKQQGQDKRNEAPRNRTEGMKHKGIEQEE
jgi:hypothetical protein